MFSFVWIHTCSHVSSYLYQCSLSKRQIMIPEPGHCPAFIVVGNAEFREGARVFCGGVRKEKEHDNNKRDALQVAVLVFVERLLQDIMSRTIMDEPPKLQSLFLWNSFCKICRVCPTPCALIRGCSPCFCGTPSARTQLPLFRLDASKGCSPCFCGTPSASSASFPTGKVNVLLQSLFLWNAFCKYGIHRRALSGLPVAVLVFVERLLQEACVDISMGIP